MRVSRGRELMENSAPIIKQDHVSGTPADRITRFQRDHKYEKENTALASVDCAFCFSDY